MTTNEIKLDSAQEIHDEFINKIELHTVPQVSRRVASMALPHERHFI